MSNILINNFPRDARAFTMAMDYENKAIAGNSDKKSKKYLLGYDDATRNNEVIDGALSSFFLSLIIHDEITLYYGDYRILIEKIGGADTLKLLDRKILKIVFNRVVNLVVQESTLTITGHMVGKDPIEHLEETLKSSPSFNLHEKSLLLQYTDNAKILFNKDITHLTHKELSSDLSRRIFSELGITTQNPHDIHPLDGYKLLRIADTIEALILQNELSISSLVQDGFVQQYLDSKLGALRPKVASDSVAQFSKIIKMKGIPDLYNLYKHGTIKMEDIIACRDTFSGGLFRKWYASTDYDEQKVLQALINKSTNESNVIKLARLIFPNVLGLIAPITGVAISVIDSYIVSKLVAGWNPSIFLDNVFKRKIDQFIATKELSEKRRQMIERFGNIKRNDPCPCQGGKKFKSCHGK